MPFVLRWMSVEVQSGKNGNMKDYIPTDEELAELLNSIQEIG